MSNYVTIKDISKYTILIMTIPSLGERLHFHALNTLKKSKFRFLEVLETTVLAMGP